MKKLIILILVFINSTLFAKEIKPSDVYVKVKFVIEELELIKKEMGKFEIKRFDLQINNVSPREVFFQALILFTKVNHFAFEYLRVENKKIDIPKEITPKNVYEVINKILDLINKIKLHLNIKEISSKIELDKTKTPTDVFREILYANRLISHLLDRGCFHDRVFSQINLAINYTTLILSHLNADRKAMELYMPKYERYKTHIDVYMALLESFKIVKSIFNKLNLKMLDLNIDSIDRESIIPSDVYNLSSLIVSELSYIHSKLNIPKEPYDIIYPNHILPSHVYQRIKLLNDKLSSIKGILDEKK